MSTGGLNIVIYLGVAVLTAIFVPIGGGWLTYQYTANPVLSVVVVALAVYHLMAIAVAIFSLYQYVPESHAIGPSFMAGCGILLLGMTVVPILALPGAVWLYVLPFDEQGHLNWGATLQLDLTAFEEPHHN